MPRNSESCLLSLCVFSMPVIVLCRQINAQCIFIVLDLKHEAIHVGRLMSAVFLLTHHSSGTWEMWRGILLGIYCNPQVSQVEQQTLRFIASIRQSPKKRCGKYEKTKTNLYDLVALVKVLS